MNKEFEDLKIRWNELTATVKSEIRDKWWKEKLLKKYNESERKYHNFDHIGNMFMHFDDCKPMLKSPEIVAFGIFFHDIAYDPKSSDQNEENSINLFKEYASEAGIAEDSEVYNEVVRLISLTATHLTEEHKSENVFGDCDEHYFLDIDMAILGSTQAEYDIYSAKIKEEYYFLSDKIYKDLRSKVLKSFLQIPKIFATEKFHTKFEQQARNNIEHEIQLLKN